MSTNDFMNNFWYHNQYEPCSPSETTLYHYLLFEAERQQWAMPFKVPTQMLVSYTGLSKQSVIDAREDLQRRGLITYSKGEGKGRPALYSLVPDKATEVKKQHQQPSRILQDTAHKETQKFAQKGTQDVTRDYTQEKSNEQAQVPTQELTQELAHDEAIENTQDVTREEFQDESQKDAQTGNKFLLQEPPLEQPHEQPQGLSQHSTDNFSQQDTQKELQPLSLVLPLSVLREKVLNDKQWQDEKIYELAEEGIQVNNSELTGQIEDFFKWQEQNGVTERDEAACRRHAINNIRSRLKKRQQTPEQASQSTISSQNATDGSGH